MATPATPAPAAPAPTSPFGRLFGALFFSKKTFEEIAQRPNWLLPVVLLTILNLAVVAVFSQRVGWTRFMTQQLEQNPRMAQMSPQQRQQTIERAASFAKYAAYGGTVISYAVIVAVLAAILMAAFNIFSGSGVRYSSAAGIVAHAMMPLAIVSLLGILTLYLKDPDTVNLENLVASNAGPLVGAEAPKWLTRLAGSLDLFSFWCIVLLGMGFSAANPKKASLGKAIGIVVVIWAAYVLLRVGWTAAFS